MGELSLRDIGKMIAAARREARADIVIDDQLIGTLDEAETVQAVATEVFNEPIAGYKIGATSPQAQEILNCSEPFFAPIFPSTILPSGCEYKTPPGFFGAEGEFAFVLASNLPAQSAPYSVDQVAAAVDTCHAAIELVSSRFRNMSTPSLLTAIADMGMNEANILADPSANWRDADLEATEVTAFIDGVEQATGWGSNAMDGPLHALAWLATKLSAQGIGLRAGQTVLTGTCIGVLKAEPESLIEVDFGWLGRVGVRIT